jgi:hypothetical protein
VGCLPTGVAIGGDSKEFEKALGAALIDGRALLSLDNMEQPIQGHLLCQVLSQQRGSSCSRPEQNDTAVDLRGDIHHG